MNASKTLIASIVAATIVGTVGFVSAQTTDTQVPASPKSTDPMNTTGDRPATPADMSSPGYVAPATDAGAEASTRPAADSAAPPADIRSSTEPMPKADRN
jgi:cell division protein FtsN